MAINSSLDSHINLYALHSLLFSTGRFTDIYSHAAYTFIGLDIYLVWILLINKVNFYTVNSIAINSYLNLSTYPFPNFYFIHLIQISPHVTPT